MAQTCHKLNGFTWMNTIALVYMEMPFISFFPELWILVQVSLKRRFLL